MTYNDAKKINHYAELKQRFEGHLKNAVARSDTGRAALAARCIYLAEYDVPCDITAYSDHD